MAIPAAASLPPIVSGGIASIGATARRAHGFVGAARDRSRRSRADVDDTVRDTARSRRAARQDSSMLPHAAGCEDFVAGAADAAFLTKASVGQSSTAHPAAFVMLRPS